MGKTYFGKNPVFELVGQKAPEWVYIRFIYQDKITLKNCFIYIYIYFFAKSLVLVFWLKLSPAIDEKMLAVISIYGFVIYILSD